MTLRAAYMDNSWQASLLQLRGKPLFAALAFRRNFQICSLATPQYRVSSRLGKEVKEGDFEASKLEMNCQRGARMTL